MSNRVNTTVLTSNASMSIINSSVGITNVNVTMGPPPVTMTIHGRQPPVGDHFDPSAALYPSSMVIGDNRYLHYHVIVWTKLFGQDVTDYGCVYVNGDGLRLCFNSKISLQKFERWLKRYTRVFFGDGSLDQCYAPHPVSGKMMGYFVEDAPTPTFSSASALGASVLGGSSLSNVQNTYLHAKPHETISETFLPDWVMIVRHASKRVIRMANGWFFSDAKDGVMFKMMRG